MTYSKTWRISIQKDPPPLSRPSSLLSLAAAAEEEEEEERAGPTFSLICQIRHEKCIISFPPSTSLRSPAET